MARDGTNTDSLAGFREDSDPLPALVELIVCPPVVYAASSWAARKLAGSFSACPAGGQASSARITGTAANVLDALIPFLTSLLTVSWGLLIAVFGVLTIFAGINENGRAAVRRMAESSALIFSLVALTPLAAGGIACL